MILNRLLLCVATIIGLGHLSHGQDAKRPPLVITTASGTTVSVDWVDEGTIETVAKGLSATGGGTITFPAGVYDFDRGVWLRGVDNVQFIGQPGCVFRMRPISEFGKIRITKSAPVKGGTFHVDHPELMRVGRRYQITRPDLRGNRIIELTATAIDQGEIQFGEVKHASVKTLPEGGWVVPELNFFTGFKCSRISFRGIDFDGNHDVANHDLGDKEFIGHTTHCGLLFWNSYHGTPEKPAVRPVTRGFSVVDCSFRGLLGRGVVVYNTGDIEIRDCRFEDFGAEAIEIDHLSMDATITRCSIVNARVGIRLNDCSDVIVISCHINSRITGIHITRALKAPDTNCRIVIGCNIFTEGKRAVVVDADSRENMITSNSIGCSGIALILKGDQTLVKGNVISGSPSTAILDHGEGNDVNDNMIIPPANPPRNYNPIRVGK